VAVAASGGAAETASVLIAGEEFVVAPETPFVFGRADADGVVGLDSQDMGISAVAGSIEFRWRVWWLVNQSTKRFLRIEYPAGPAHVDLGPGHRQAITTDRLNVLVPGAIYTHVLEIVVPASYAAGLRGSSGRLTTGTLSGSDIGFSERERDALTALFSGYLEPFPRRREHPNTYEEAARLLGADWSGDKVRKAAERVKTRFASKQSLYFEGPQANYDLAAHLVSTGVVTGEDLARLSRPPR
jgi:hypothetical protein